jgi:diguanylate cyclase (GGDEF)-like protein
MVEVVREADTVARLGGDEFAVLMEGVDSQDASRVANRIVAVLREPVEVDGRSLSLSVSVGITFAGPVSSTEQLLSEADSAMYEAKSNGRNRAEAFRSVMRDRAIERLSLTNSFESALASSRTRT